MPTDTFAFDARDVAAAAILAAANTAVDHAAAVMVSDGQTVTAKMKNDLLCAELVGWVLSIKSGSPLRVQLQEYVDDLNRIPSEIHTKVTRRDAD